MFESRLQLAQAIITPAVILTGVAILLFMIGPIVVAIFLLVLAHGAAAVGFYFYAEDKGYPALLGVPLGVGLGVFGGIFLLILPDENKGSVYEAERRLAREALENARRRDKGYEVLDDEDD